jgi:hypothetical protein
MTSVLLAPRADHGHVVRVLTDRVAARLVEAIEHD